jgi:hypothetical protein
MEPSEYEIKELNARFGRAYFFADVLHRGLCNLYALAQLPPEGPVTQPMVEENLAVAFGATLGWVWQRLRDRFSENDAVLLAAAVKTRNFIAHHFWYERNHLMFSTEGCAAAVAELDSAVDLFRHADALADPQVSALASRLGVTQDALDAALAEAKAGLPPEPILKRRRLRKQETIVGAYLLPSARGSLLFEADDGLVLQLCDRGLGWSMHDRRVDSWQAVEKIQRYLPTVLDPRPSGATGWRFELPLGTAAILRVRPGTDPGRVAWTVVAGGQK